jgi:peptidoglycan/LPS O-acetylase OafA/YrhL
MDSAARPDPGGERLIGLELLRFMAALGVLVWHYQHFMFVGHESASWNPIRLPLHWLFAPFYTYGFQGVELFWCISGFIFTWKYGSVISRSGISFGRFAWLRFSRLYPLHFATLLVVTTLQYFYWTNHGQPFVYLYNDTRHFVLNLLFANWWGFQLGESFNGPSWSISAEVLIYLVFFAVAQSAGTGWRIDLFALAGFSVVAWAVKILFGITLGFTGAGTFFYLGALTMHLHRWIEALGARWRWRFVCGCAAVIVVSALLVAAHVLKIAGATLPMFPAAILLVQLAIRPQGRRARAWLTALGNLTYASYMLHFPMQLAAMLIFAAAAVPVQSLIYADWFMLAYLGSVLAAAAMVFRFVERPAQNWLRGMVRSRPAVSDPQRM